MHDSNATGPSSRNRSTLLLRSTCNRHCQPAHWLFSRIPDLASEPGKPLVHLKLRPRDTFTSCLNWTKHTLFSTNLESTRAFNAPVAIMSAPAGEAPLSSAAPSAAHAPQIAPPAVAQAAPAQAPVVAQKSVSGAGGNVAQAAGPFHTVPVTPTSGAPGGSGPSVPRQAAAPTRDTFNRRSLGPALNSQVNKVCGTPLVLPRPGLSSWTTRSRVL